MPASRSRTSRRDADPAQRLPAAQEAPRLRRSINGQIYRTEVQAERREGTDLFLKSRRAPLDSKCKLEVPPGQHGQRRQRRQRLSDYGLQLREKQKLRRMYGVLERQFRNYYKKAAAEGATGENLLRCSSAGSTTSCTAWASAPPAPRRASWSATRQSRSTGRW
jgi:hypothetical protein